VLRSALTLSKGNIKYINSVKATQSKVFT